MIRKNVIVYSTLFPNIKKPSKGIFVAELVKALSEEVDVAVMNPLSVFNIQSPLLMFKSKNFFESNIPLERPLFFNFPKYLKGTDGYLMAAFTRSAFRKVIKKGVNTIVHAHFGYPDAVAASILAKEQNLPLVVTVHGSDINVLARHHKRRDLMIKAFDYAQFIVTVSDELAKKVIRLGVPSERVFNIPNGVDLAKFEPGEKDNAKNRLGLSRFRRIVLAVGNLVPVKAYDRLIKAISLLDPDIGLLIVGDGPERESLAKLCNELKVRDRVKFAGAVPHSELSVYYQGADFLVICSHSEGWPTIIFEAFACGLPIIASNVGGISEAVSAPDLGILIQDNEPDTIAKAIESAYQKKWNEHAAIKTAGKHSWSEIAKKYLSIYNHIA